MLSDDDDEDLHDTTAVENSKDDDERSALTPVHPSCAEEANDVTIIEKVTAAATTATTDTRKTNLNNSSTAASKATTTFQELYPGIVDYDALKYMQLRHIFVDHAFASGGGGGSGTSTWQAMQDAGWTFSCGTYKSPHGSRTFTSSNDITYHLDQCAIRPLLHNHTFLLAQQQQQPQQQAEANSTIISSSVVATTTTTTDAENDQHLTYRDHSSCKDGDVDDSINHTQEEEEEEEHWIDLRNNICYHMQLLMESRKRKWSQQQQQEQQQQEPTSQQPKQQQPHDDDNSDSSSSLDITTTDRLNNDDNNITSNSTRYPRRQEQNNNSVTYSHRGSSTRASVTAVDKGSDLYLHRKGRKQQQQQQQPFRPKAGTQFLDNDDTAALAQLQKQHFPTIAECIATIQQQTLATSVCQDIEAYYLQQESTQWRYLLSTNHSLLLYGNGSKYNLIQQFCQQQLSHEGYVVQISGFDPDVTIDSILDIIVQLFLEGSEPSLSSSSNKPKLGMHHRVQISRGILCSDGGGGPDLQRYHHPTAVDRAVHIARAIVCRYTTAGSNNPPQPHPIFLVIHSIDGPGLGTKEAQDALAALIAHSSIGGGASAILRLIASIDHVDASAALWTTCTSSQFSWIWKKVHTYRPYVHEMAMLIEEEDSKVRKSAVRGTKIQSRGAVDRRDDDMSSNKVMIILKSLASRYGEVMQTLAQLQLKQMALPTLSSSSKKTMDSKSIHNWVQYDVWRAACKGKFIIDKDAKLRTLQSELMDHQLLLSKTEGPHELVCIPYHPDKLQEICSYRRSTDN